MKTGIVIVNTARGAVMDEDALVKALDSGKVRSVGLDVFEEEPKIHPGLVANRNVCLLPHMGTWTIEVSRSIVLERLKGLMGFADDDEDGRVECGQLQSGSREGKAEQCRA